MNTARLLFASILMCLAVAGLHATAAAQPVAIVTDVQGTASYGKTVANQLAILTSLDAGDRVRLAPGARVTMLYYADGAQFEARGPGTIILEATRPKSSEGAVVESRPQAGGTGVRLKSGGLVQGALVMRKVSLRIVAPDALVLSTQPELAWTDSRNEASYDVALFDAAGACIFETKTQTRSVTLPERVKLASGQSYALAGFGAFARGAGADGARRIHGCLRGVACAGAKADSENRRRTRRPRRSPMLCGSIRTICATRRKSGGPRSRRRAPNRACCANEQARVSPENHRTVLRGPIDGDFLETMDTPRNPPSSAMSTARSAPPRPRLRTTGA